LKLKKILFKKDWQQIMENDSKRQPPPPFPPQKTIEMPNRGNEEMTQKGVEITNIRNTRAPPPSVPSDK